MRSLALEQVSIWLPRLSLASLWICCITGILLCYYYSPGYNAFRSLQELTYLVPFGKLIRYTHYLTGQMLAITLTLHGMDFFILKDNLMPSRKWFRLTTAVVLSYIALFFGYILKADTEGQFALAIAQNLLSSIPLFGKYLATVLFGQDGSLTFSFVYHCFILPVLMVWLFRPHLPSVIPSMESISFAIVLCIIFLFLPYKPQDLPLEGIFLEIKGPWFFWGIQALLKYTSIIIGALIIPFVGLGLWYSMGIFVKYRGYTRVAFIVYWAFYLALCILFGLGII